MMREKLAKYEDYKLAIAAGYVPYLPSIAQDVYHFASRERSASKYAGDFDLAEPGSLLYEKKTFGGWRLVGAMYDAPPSDTPEQLDKLIPLGLVRWHTHTNICLPAGVTEQDVFNGEVHTRPLARDFGSTNSQTRVRFGYLADPRFGFKGDESRMRRQARRPAATFTSRSSAGWCTSILSRARTLRSRSVWRRLAPRVMKADELRSLYRA